MCERIRSCKEEEEDEEATDSDEEEGRFDVDHFAPVDRNRNGIERGSSGGDDGGADSLGQFLIIKWRSYVCMG